MSHLNLCTELFGLCSGTPSHVTEAGESDCLALDALACVMEKVLCEVQSAETCSLRTEDRTTPCAALAGEDSCVVLAGQLLVHSVQITDLTSTDSYVTCRDIGIGADASPELIHEGLAESHDLSIRLADGIEVRTTLCTAHRQSCQSVLECLLETEELQHGRSNCLMEAETSLVGADGRVELNPVTEVGLNLSLVVNPGNPECEDTVRLYDSLDSLAMISETFIFFVF